MSGVYLANGWNKWRKEKKKEEEEKMEKKLSTSCYLSRPGCCILDSLIREINIEIALINQSENRR